MHFSERGVSVFQLARAISVVILLFSYFVFIVIELCEVHFHFQIIQ